MTSCGVDLHRCSDADVAASADESNLAQVQSFIAATAAEIHRLTLQLREEEDAIVVPSTALHWEGCCHVVFVRDKDYMKEGSYKVFHTRSVRPGVVSGDTTEMIAGLLPGEVIVTKGSGVLRAELLKGNLGAG